jgi:diguanylate cyclase (GGDEF)-like protein
LSTEPQSQSLPARRERTVRAETFQRRGLVAVVALMLVVLWGLVVFVTSLQRHRLLDEGARELTQMNRAVTEQVDALFRAAGTDLRVIDAWLQANPSADPLRDPFLARTVQSLRSSSNVPIELGFATGDGRRFLLPVGANGLGSAADAAWFRRALAPGEPAMVIGEPEQNAAGKWVLPVAWKLAKPRAGLVLAFANVDLDELTAVHERLRVKPAGTITLVRTDGVLLARTPLNTVMLGRDVSSAPGFRAEYGVKPSGSFRFDGANTDGVERIVTFYRLPDAPVIVLVTRAVQDLLAVFVQRRMIAYVAVALLTLLVIGFTFVLHRSLVQLQSARKDLQRMATSDELTGLLNRREFLEAAQREHSRAKRYSRPCSVLMLDLDLFKRVNDTHGHAVGDVVLKTCAAAWKRLLRDQDLLGRLGGEEFCAVLPETPALAGLQAAERMRRAIEALSFEGKQGTFKVTTSIGVTEVVPADEQVADVIERADRALYRAKLGGRNRVERVDGSPSPQAASA